MSLDSKLKAAGGPSSKSGTALVKAAAVKYAAQIRSAIKGK